jgi:hypothetical protein
VVVVAVAAATLAGCGKKGPPLAPYVLLPSAPAKIDTRRLGDEAYITLTIPTTNIDASRPADLRRIDVFAFTATTMPTRSRALELGTVIASVPVAAPPMPGGALAGQRSRTPEVKGAAAQGAIVTVRDVLTPEAFIPKALPAPPSATPPPPGLRPDPPGPLRRVYIAVGFSDRGRPGPQSTPVELPLTPVPGAPDDLQVSYTGTSVLVSWEPSGGLIGFLLDQGLPLDVLPEAEDAGRRPAAAPALPAGPTRYNLYRELAPDPLVLPTAATAIPAGATTVPRPLTVAPLDELSFTDAIQFERERCYVVRAVRGVGPEAVESPASERRCVTPVDVFPPAPPTSVSAVPGEGAISLIWEPSADLDVAGYVVLRGDTANATLLPLTVAPVPGTQFTDTTVMPGRTYVYAVVAVDARVPVPNVSAESARIEETAR